MPSDFFVNRSTKVANSALPPRHQLLSDVACRCRVHTFTPSSVRPPHPLWVCWPRFGAGSDSGAGAFVEGGVRPTPGGRGSGTPLPEPKKNHFPVLCTEEVKILTPFFFEKSARKRNFWAPFYALDFFLVSPPLKWYHKGAKTNPW